MGGFMNIRAAIGLSQEMARNICSIHISNGNTTAPHCISCDQEFPCSTLQFAKTIEMITVTAVRGPGTHRPMLNAMEKWVIDALQNIGHCARLLFDERSDEYSQIFEQLTLLHGLTGITQTGLGGEAHSSLQVNLIHPKFREPIPMWALKANLITQELSIILWLNPGDTSATRPFLVDLMIKSMSTLQVADLLDWWQNPDMSPSCFVDYVLPPNGLVVLETLTTLVTATTEISSQLSPDLVFDWGDVYPE